MLSVERCRRVLKQSTMSDEDVTQIRDTLYSFATLLVDSYVREHPDKFPNSADGKVQP